jgi:hypothetical protein
METVTATVGFDPAVVTDTARLELYRFDTAGQAWENASVGPTSVQDDTLVAPINKVGEFALVEPGAARPEQTNSIIYLPLMRR